MKSALCRALCVLFLLLYSNYLHGKNSEVVQVSDDQVQVLISPRDSKPWLPGDAVCIMRNGQRISCGRVDESNLYGARVIVTLTSGSDVLLGDLVQETRETSQVYHVLPGTNGILITHKPDRPWKKGDGICVFQVDRMVACGEIVETDSSTATVNVHVSRGENISEGDRVKESPAFYSKIVEVFPENNLFSFKQIRGDHFSGAERVEVLRDEQVVATAVVNEVQGIHLKARLIWKIKDVQPGDWVRKDQTFQPVAQKAEEKQPEPESKVSRNVSAIMTNVGDCFLYLLDGKGICTSNLTAGVNYLSPTLRYEMTFQKHFSVGLMPMYFNASAGGGSFKGFGLFGTLAYYPTIAYEGMWLQMGLGLSALTAQLNVNREQLISPTVFSALGWRWMWDSGFNMGLGLGVNYVFNTSPGGFHLSFSGLLPAFTFDAGWKL